MKSRHKTAELLRQAGANEEILFLSELDAFSLVLILGPAIIPPSQWLKKFHGGAGDAKLEQQDARRGVDVPAVSRKLAGRARQGRGASLERSIVVSDQFKRVSVFE